MTALWFTVALSSLVGSVHCVAMCGPLVGLHGSTLRLALAHSAGRLATYATLGALGGLAGRAVDLAGNLGAVQRAATIVSGSVIVLWGLHQLAVALGYARDPKLSGKLFRSSLVQIGKRRPLTRAWLVGVLTGLLPCGWLWAFVVTAAGTGSPLLGAGVMAMFWLGTVPAMTGVLVLGGWLKRRMPIVTAIVLVALGVATLATRWTDAGVTQVEKPHCHCHEDRS
jgi:sulfite exporter TauE/SafE